MMAPSWMSRALVLVALSGEVINATRGGPFVAPPQELLDAERIIMQPQPQGEAAAVQAPQLNMNGWTAGSNSWQGSLVPQNSIDGNPNTIWHTEWTPNNAPLPHILTIDMHATYIVNGISYLPRQDGSSNGNIGAHEIYTSTDLNNWNLVAYGTWLDDNTEKTGDFENTPARYLRLVAKSEAGNRGPWTSVAEIRVYGTKTFIDRGGWTASSDSQQGGLAPGNVLDGDPNTIWHTQWTPNNAGLPHQITIDMKATKTINGLTYLPRQDGNQNGNIGQYQVLVSTDGNNFNQVASGTWPDDQNQKSATFGNVNARYVRLRALSEAGNRGPWTSCAEINISNDGGYTPPSGSKGSWGPTINFPLVPVAASVEHDTGKVVAWSSWSAKQFGGNGGLTVTALFDPNAKTVTQRVVTNTGHDMFCPSISQDANGRTLVTGGDSSNKASIYDPNSDQWSSTQDLKIPRGYHASATCSDGRIFVIGGSWSGGEGGKNGEIYDPKTGQWSLLGDCPVAPMLTNDAQGVYRADNHAWLFGWKQGYVFQAGPSKAMNWYRTSGNGWQQGAGTRSDDNDAMCGDAVMYDAVNGKILAVGGSKDYQNSPSTSNAYRITIGNPGTQAQVQKLGNMAYQRIFHNSVVLPDGKVFISGGQSLGAPFNDANSIYTPEMWDPNTGAFTKMTPNTIARVYHSMSLLLPDATVLTGGGGLCGTCSTNHFDAQIFTPPYLLNADGSKAGRPVINSVSTTSVVPGDTITVNCNTGISAMSLVRYGTSTHTVNTDQRRIPLQLTNLGGNSYRVSIPNDYGVALPGYWMLFAMDNNGRPSVAKTIHIRGP